MRKAQKRKLTSLVTISAIVILIVLLSHFQKKFFFYWLNLLFLTLIPTAFLCGLGRKNGSYFYPVGKAQQWAKKTRKIVDHCIYLVIILASLGSFIFVTYPMLLDLPFVLSGETVSLTGTISHVSEISGRHGHLGQEVTIESQTFSIYFESDFKKEDDIEIDYLPNSRLVVQVYELVN
ncbi:MAG: hypothetical protein K0Q56_1695 [Sporolactobacillus laevolacticus]|jgi:predicted membrane channel-forming protein YqfA (hemolysin III family)|nr:hypothetical protein [Sporolactobacillus laevolacticus]